MKRLVRKYFEPVAHIFMWLAIGWMLFMSVCAHAQTTNISAGASVATINAAIAAANATAGNPVIQFAAGSYPINGVVTVGCPSVASSITIQGPVAAYRPPASVLPSSYSYSTPYTANLNGSLSSGWGWVVGSNGCTKPITIQYFNWDGGQPSGGGGGWINVVAGESNLTITRNYAHGNWASTSTSHDYDDTISLEGVGFAQFPINSNIVTTWNVFGNGTSDCNPIMNLTTYQGDSYIRSGGYCGAVGVHASTTNFVFQNNAVEHLEQGLKFFQGSSTGGDITHTFMLNNALIDSNDFGQWHRIATEGQQAVVANNSTGSVFNWTNNSVHDAIDPQYGMFGASLPMCCSTFSGYSTGDNQVNFNNNTMVGNVPTPSFTGYGNEWWSTGSSSNNLFQGIWGTNQFSSDPPSTAIGWGETSTAVRHWVASNNICQLNHVGGTGGPLCVGQEVEAGSPPPPTQSGNTTTTAVAVRASVAPTIFPPAGPQTFPLTVTLNDSGYTSGAGPLGNTGIWYTTDGSTPVPGSGTAKRVDNGGQVVLLAASTVKAVGMWGANNQPASYPSGYGFVASATVTSAFTSSGFFISPSGNDANPGTSGSPWLTPNHALTCGSTITALAGTYSSANFQNGKWGTVTCPGANNVVWLQCQTFDTCKITSTSTDGMWVDQSFWGVQGWEVTVTGGTSGACFHFGPSGTTSVHHVIFANDVANGCKGGGFTSYSKPASTTASVDYVTYVGNVAYSAASGTTACYSGLNIFQPIAFDSASGTHIYVAGNFSYGNVDSNNCGGGSGTTDGEGINLDTFDFSTGGGTPYTQQAVVQNNLESYNGARGIEVKNNAAGSTHAPIFVLRNTMVNSGLDQNSSTPSGLAELGIVNALNVSATRNLVFTAHQYSTVTNSYFGMGMASGNGTDTVDTNYAAGISGNNTFLQSSPGFSFGAGNVLGTNPAFVSGPCAGVGNTCTPVAQPSGMIAAAVSAGNSAAANTTALTSCNTSANSASKSCVMPAGSFAVNAFTWTGPAGLYGAGAASTILTGAADTNCQITMAGNNWTFSGWKHICPQTTRDSAHWNIFIGRTVTGFRVDSMEVQGGDAGGFINFFSDHGIFTNNYVHDTLADCLYTTDGSNNITVDHNKMRNCGDDSISNVSYTGDADGTVSNNLDINNDVGFQSNGRGITVVGGQNITIQGNLVQSTTQNACIYLADEPSFNSRAVSNIIVQNNVLNTCSGSTGQPGILAYAGQGTVSNVLVQGNTVTSAVHDGMGTNSTGGVVSNIAFVGNPIVSPGSGVAISNTGSTGNTFCLGNTLNGSPVAGGSCGGTNSFTPTGSTLTTIPGAPACTGKTNVADCMSAMIANLTATASGASAYGYQAVSNTSVTDTLFPQWLCAGTGVLNPSIPAGLITPGCGGGATPTLTGGHQANTGNVNTLLVGAPAVQQLAVATYSDGSSQNLPDTFGNTATWTSSAPSILTVGSTGLVSCIAGGTGNSQVVSAPGGVHFSPWGWTCTISVIQSGLVCKGGGSPSGGLPGPGGTAPTQGLPCHP